PREFGSDGGEKKFGGIDGSAAGPGDNIPGNRLLILSTSVVICMPSTLLFCAFCGDLVFSTEAKRAAGDIAPWLAIKEEAANDIAPWLTGKEEEEDEEVTKGHEELLAAEEEEKEEEEEEEEEEPVRRWTRVMNSLGSV
ncbi:hypothetical protein U1Q18_037332, partial [Sarracenia purpurea var. burkii]